VSARRRREPARTPRTDPAAASGRSPEALDAFVAGYFAEYQEALSRSRGEQIAPPAAGAERPVLRLHQMIQSGAKADLEAAWAMVLVLIERAPDAGTIGFIAAGPLEDIVRMHNGVLGDRILAEARRSPAFRRALAGIWGWASLPEPFGSRLRSLAGVGDTPAGDGGAGSRRTN
jgi:Family of unknown function (DUF6869)